MKKELLSWKTLVIVTIFTVVGAVLANSLFLSYKSTASVAFPLTLQEYKLMSEVITSPQSFDRYAAKEKQRPTETPELTFTRLEVLRGTVVRGASNWFEPIQRVSKLDLKNFSGLAPNLSDGAALLGYRISSNSSTADEAQKQTTLLADFVVDANLRELLVEKVKNAVVNREAIANSIASKQAGRTYNVSMLKNRLEQRKQISTDYPGVNAGQARQVISLENGGERYLPLPSQMAAVETNILDIEEEIARNTRQFLQLRAEGEMLDAQTKIVQASVSGRDLMASLLADTGGRLSNAVNEYDKQRLLDYTDNYTAMKTRYLDSPRFVVTADKPPNPTRSVPGIILLFFAFGLLVSLAYQFWDRLLELMRAVRQEQPSTILNLENKASSG